MSQRLPLAIALGATVTIPLTPNDKVLPVTPARTVASNEVRLLVPYRPSPVATGGRTRVSYELHLAIPGTQPIRVMSIDVIAAGSGRTLATIAGRDLSNDLRPRSSASSASDGVVDAHGSANVYIDLSVARAREVAGGILHRVRFEKSGQVFTVAGGRTTIDAVSPPSVGAPLRGGPWVAVYVLARDGSHRRQLYAVDGVDRIPGRYAIDFMPAPGTVGIGAEVLAVADGQIVAVRDREEDGKANGWKEGDEAGNYIVLRLGPRRYAFYEHLQHGIRVAAGQWVRMGEVIGRVGTTGHVTSPHLHFHIANGISPLGAEGEPFRLVAGNLVGSYPPLEAFDAGGAWNTLQHRRLRELPPPQSVILFEASVPRPAGARPSCRG